MGSWGLLRGANEEEQTEGAVEGTGQDSTSNSLAEEGRLAFKFSSRGRTLHEL